MNIVYRVVLALGLGLAGCGGGTDNPDDVAAPAEESGGEEPAPEPTAGEPVDPAYTPAEGGGGVDVNGGDVGGGSPSDE